MVVSLVNSRPVGLLRLGVCSAIGDIHCFELLLVSVDVVELVGGSITGTLLILLLHHLLRRGVNDHSIFGALCPRRRRQKSEHVRRRVDKNKLVVFLCDDRPLGRWVHVIKENQVFHCLNRLTGRVRKKELDIDRELAPAHLMHLKWRLSHCENGLRKARIKLKFDF